MVTATSCMFELKTTIPMHAINAKPACAKHPTAQQTLDKAAASSLHPSAPVPERPKVSNKPEILNPKPLNPKPP